MENKSITVEFPLRGEWAAEHTPAERVPSHGTDHLAQTYAYDFVRIEIEVKGLKFFRGSMLRNFLVGVVLDGCYGWSEPIHAPFSGTVVAAKDGWPERERLHLLRDLVVVLKNILLLDPNKNNDLRLVWAITSSSKCPGRRYTHSLPLAELTLLVSKWVMRFKSDSSSQRWGIPETLRHHTSTFISWISRTFLMPKAYGLSRNNIYITC